MRRPPALCAALALCVEAQRGVTKEQLRSSRGDVVELKRFYLSGPGATYLSDHPEAVCNDGSPGVYFHKKGKPGAPWLLHLEGGMWCWDERSCLDRDLGLRSSDSTDEFIYRSGIYATATGPFHDAHVTFIHYCSSDAFLGNRVAGPETFHTHFRGQAIVEATLRELVKRGLGARTAADRLLFGGCSAGARGALATLDYVQPFLASIGADVDVRGMFDSPLWLDIQPLYPFIQSLQEQTNAVLHLVNASGRVSHDCRLRYTEDLWKCLYGEFRVPFLKTPFFLSCQQYDQFQLSWDLRGPGAWIDPGKMNGSTVEGAYVQAFRGRAYEFLMSTLVPAGSVYFSSACVGHCACRSNEDILRFTVPTVAADKFNGQFRGRRITMLEAIEAWWQGWRPQNGHLVDSCGGTDCGCREADERGLQDGRSPLAPSPVRGQRDWGWRQYAHAMASGLVAPFQTV